ncbi:glycylpeptide N-tetradecanoyltransferase [Cadophora gregata]|uniref:glycylpeptide N-tetradecanoyltransferase n=1 Tax=Cadophora gregata TaxID=51156 RepID=UPI0026DC030F|nr:glycylpeptide N-tetradecanoyltransferase [Cadophora gregata]KAK0103585.1 glycylpeptide N-tetradecanoyltransferase [Cadophora gregata]KAK0107778.1 glycylpeptide N-tetradecanoyltransferase [Cadophora gregata f. sp. sojae]
MLRIDELVEFGCRFLCSVLYIVNDTFTTENPEKIQKFMRAVKGATDFILASPAEAYPAYIDIKPQMDSVTNRKIY